ncbi:MAG: phosphotransferase [Pseudomonadales bacterium]|jgi:hypothetical protein|nr:phosphotransferase [Pseudomonadales bacterium]
MLHSPRLANDRPTRSVRTAERRCEQVAPWRFPACRAEITTDWLLNTLQPHPSFRRDPIAAVRLSDLGDGIGQLSALTLAELTCRSGARRTLVVKIQAPVPEMHEVALSYGHYESEVGFYGQMAREVRLRTPEIYVCALDQARNRVLIVMEAFTDWHSPDQLEGATAEEVAIATRALSSLASTYWESPPLKRFPWLKTATSPAFASMPSDYAACVPELLTRFEARWPANASATLDRISAGYAGLQQAVATGTQVLAHFDFRVENLFFGPDGSLAVIDWQLMHMNNPANDLAYLLATNVDVSLRRDIERDMMHLYLEGLRECGIVGYGLAELERDFRLALLYISVIPVIGGANADMGNARSAALFEIMGGRLLTAIEDWQALDALGSIASA